VPVQFTKLPTIESPRLLTGEVHLWTLNLAAGLNEACFWHLLDEEEQDRACRFRHAVSKRQYILSRGVLRWLLGCYLGADPTGLSFLSGSRGKPRLSKAEPERGLVFNVSHSADTSVFALALDTALGVDIEAWRTVNNMEGVAMRCFAPRELAYWRGLPENARLPAFFAFWTCKEAFAKAVGAGIAVGLERCAIDLVNGPRLVLIPEEYGLPRDWTLLGLHPGRGHSAALCAKGNIREVRTGDLTETLGQL
jgi:4'-phosphopantetheinyl transferase